MSDKESFENLAAELARRLDPASIPDSGVKQIFVPIWDDRIRVDSEGRRITGHRTICLMLWDVEQVSCEKLREIVGEGEPIEERNYSKPFGFLHKLLFRPTKSGGAPRGVRPETAVHYQILADWYYKTGLSQREFCKEADVSRRKLNRALKFIKKQKLVPEN